MNKRSKVKKCLKTHFVKSALVVVNNIKTTAGRQVNEIMLLQLLKSYCLPRLLYGCDVLIVAGGKVLNKLLQYYCESLPLSYLV